MYTLLSPENTTVQPHETVIPGDTVPFIYFGTEPWENTVLSRVNCLQAADFPPTRLVGVARTTCIEPHYHRYPIYDMIIFHPGLPPILFSGEHNRLLYDILTYDFPPYQISPIDLSRTLLKPDPDRVLLIEDDHDDFNMVPYPEIRIGNWGSHGFRRGYWGEVIFLGNRGGDIPTVEHAFLEGLPNTPCKLTRIRLSSQAARLAMNVMGQRNFIYTLDADAHANFSGKDFTSERKAILRSNLEMVVRSGCCELIQFTTSPAFCPDHKAIRIWNFFREVLLKLVA